MARSTATCKKNPTEDFTKNGCTDHKATEDESHRKDIVTKMAKHTVHGTKERFNRRKTDHRSCQTERVHQTPKIQDVDNGSNQTTPTQELLDSISGSERRVLSHSNNTQEETIPRLPLQRAKLEVQSPPVWPEYRASRIYKINCSYSKSVRNKRNLVPAVPRRPTDNSSHTGRMLPPCTGDNIHPKILRVDNQRKEKSPKTRTSLRVARRQVRPTESYSSGNYGQNRRIKAKNNISRDVTLMFKTHNNAVPRTSQLDRPVSPNYPSITIENKKPAQSVQKTSSGRSNTSQLGNEARTGQVDHYPYNTSSSRPPKSNNNNSERCVRKGLGIRDQRNSIQRTVRRNNELSDSHSRIASSLVRPLEGDRERSSNSGPLRQQQRRNSSTTLHIDSIPPNDDLRTDMEESNGIRMGTHNVSHPRKIQRLSRSVVKKCHIVNGMVPIKRRLREIHPQRKSATTDRLVRHETQQQTEEICVAMSGQDGTQSGCHGNQLGQVETLISVSSYDLDFEGFGEVDGDQLQNGNSDNPGNTDQTLVHGIATEEHSIESYQCTLTTDSERQTRDSSNMYKTPRLDLIKKAYGQQYPGCPQALDLMAAPLRLKSIKDYEHKWKTFMNYLIKNDIPFLDITTGTVLQFLASLFYDKHLKPGTITHYKTALSVPLKTYFNIDLKVPAITDLIRAMWIQRPNKPVSAPAWSLNKVLEFLDDLPSDINKIMLFRKMAFLLLLATGWRVSELHACVRDKEYCRFTNDSTLQIRPHPSFLVKNESTQKRWSHKEVRQLQLEDGSISNLCPVSNLRAYLQCTGNYVSGDLFKNPHDHQKKLTIHQLSTHICSLIIEADPTTKRNFGKVHDIRSYAASCALAETMLVGDLVSAMNWSSPTIFYKFYLTQTEPLTRRVALPTQRC